MTYDDLAAKNPYRDVDYRQSGWQKFISALGFRTNYDAYKESLALQAKEYDAELANKQYNEEFESPVSEAARMRAAGQNPDILGTGDVAGASAPDIGDENPPVSPESDEAQVLQFVNTIMQVVTGSIGLASDIGSLRSLRLANDSQNISNVDSLLELAFNGVLNTAPLNPSTDPEASALQMNSRTAILNDVVGKRLPRRLRKGFDHAVKSFINTLPANAKSMEQYKQYLDDRTGYFRGRSSKYYDDSDDVMKIISDELMQLADDTYYKSLKNQNRSEDVTAEHLENTADYEMQLSGKTAASAENAVNAMTAQSQDMQKKLNQTMHNIISRLNGLANSDKRGHNIAEIALLMMSLMSMSQFSISPKGASFGIKMQ